MDINWSTFLPTLIATFVGLGGAFILNEFHHKNDEKTKARRLLFLLKQDIEMNKSLLSQLRESYKNYNYTVFYNVSLVVWNSVPTNIITVLKNPEIVKELSEFYYQLQHLGRKVDMIFKMTFNSDLTKDEVKRKRQILVNSLNEHLQMIFEGRICKSPDTLMVKIEYLMKKLKNEWFL